MVTGHGTAAATRQDAPLPDGDAVLLDMCCTADATPEIQYRTPQCDNQPAGTGENEGARHAQTLPADRCRLVVPEDPARALVIRRGADRPRIRAVAPCQAHEVAAVTACKSAGCDRPARSNLVRVAHAITPWPESSAGAPLRYALRRRI